MFKVFFINLQRTTLESGVGYGEGYEEVTALWIFNEESNNLYQQSCQGLRWSSLAWLFT